MSHLKWTMRRSQVKYEERRVVNRETSLYSWDHAFPKKIGGSESLHSHFIAASK